jgi:hypothetical protein
MPRAREMALRIPSSSSSSTTARTRGKSFFPAAPNLVSKAVAMPASNPSRSPSALIEVQGEAEGAFPERMFVYNYRIFDRYNRTVVSLAVLTDDRPDWRPDAFGYGAWGFGTQIRYGVAKLLDQAADPARLQSDPNPFAAVVLAHLRTLATRGDPTARRGWKLQLVKGLYDRG